jgi:hypothetical protein
MDKEGNIHLHRNMRNDFKLFNNLINKYKDSISVGVESMHSYYWLADACLEHGIPFYLGHAYYMCHRHPHVGKLFTVERKRIACPDVFYRERNL